MIDQTAVWWPVATSDELRTGQALARSLLDLPMVLFRDSSGRAVAQADRCPHRHAPLSAGCVRDGEVQCPYHGWRFDPQGRCTKVPGLDSYRPGSRALNRAVATTETCGLIWACLNANADTPPPAMPAQHDEPHDVFFMTDEVHCSIAQAAENFLDGFHTHYVHAGWIRRDAHRQKVTAKVSRIDDGVQAHYTDEGQQSGLISRLLEPKRQESMGRFRMPGIAEIEYRGPRGLSLLVTAWLTPQTTDSLRIHARIATRRTLLPARFKTMMLRRVFGVILRQDKTILEQTTANIVRFRIADAPQASPAVLDSPLDLLGPHIRNMLAGQAVQGLDQVKKQTLSL